ncbi:Fic family protein [Phaeodactylibacter xiamenensis]|uniref:Fic family protein n=1 Tax=Phaeodactylibacter xiamenensis TaxID=1524460 RepID=UPI0024A8B0F7|nr:Fic family protein [Phaeodactylibacter xiamenensis]
MLPPLPPEISVESIESKKVLKKLTTARAALAELKGVAGTIPNEHILIDTLSLQEAKDSSAIENIVTTQDELYQSDYDQQTFANPASKEVHHYAAALKTGFSEVKELGIIRIGLLNRVQAAIEHNDAGIRQVPGTVLKNDLTGEVVYTPPQDYNQILALLDNLEGFINDTIGYEVDPLVKMAIIHYQFESIHPYYDGNGRTGRILNLLYLIKEELLSIPVLYISRYIIRHRQQYYQLLQQVREANDWESWTLYMLDAVEQTAKHTIRTVKGIHTLMMLYKKRIRGEQPKLYSQDLINNLFRHPYTRVDWLQRDLSVTRLTATKYLDTLVEMQLLEKIKKGRRNYYLNQGLLDLLSGEGG